MKSNFPFLEQIPQLKALWKTAFDDSDTFIDHFFRTAFSADRCRCVTVDGNVASMLYWFDCQCREKKLAYLYAVATAPAFRRRGICHDLMEDVHGLLVARGYCGTLLVPGNPALAGLYSSMGYRYATGTAEFTCRAARDPIPLDVVAPEEYSRLRRQLLPEGGVVQEGENLDFLASQASFYAGPGILLAAARDDDTLTGLELLGDPAAAPGILRTLGAAKGTFRTPGSDRPLAMYRALDGAPPPAYFGFPFD